MLRAVLPFMTVMALASSSVQATARPEVARLSYTSVGDGMNPRRRELEHLSYFIPEDFLDSLSQVPIPRPVEYPEIDDSTQIWPFIRYPFLNPKYTNVEGVFDFDRLGASPLIDGPSGAYAPEYPSGLRQVYLRECVVTFRRLRSPFSPDLPTSVTRPIGCATLVTVRIDTAWAASMDTALQHPFVPIQTYGFARTFICHDASPDTVLRYHLGKLRYIFHISGLFHFGCEAGRLTILRPRRRSAEDETILERQFDTVPSFELNEAKGTITPITVGFDPQLNTLPISLPNVGWGLASDYAWDGYNLYYASDPSRAKYVARLDQLNRILDWSRPGKPVTPDDIAGAPRYIYYVKDLVITLRYIDHSSGRYQLTAFWNPSDRQGVDQTVIPWVPLSKLSVVNRSIVTNNSSIRIVASLTTCDMELQLPETRFRIVHRFLDDRPSDTTLVRMSSEPDAPNRVVSLDFGTEIFCDPTTNGGPFGQPSYTMLQRNATFVGGEVIDLPLIPLSWVAYLNTQTVVRVPRPEPSPMTLGETLQAAAGLTFIGSIFLSAALLPVEEIGELGLSGLGGAAGGAGTPMTFGESSSNIVQGIGEAFEGLEGADASLGEFRNPWARSSAMQAASKLTGVTIEGQNFFGPRDVFTIDGHGQIFEEVGLGSRNFVGEIQAGGTVNQTGSFRVNGQTVRGVDAHGRIYGGSKPYSRDWIGSIGKGGGITRPLSPVKTQTVTPNKK